MGGGVNGRKGKVLIMTLMMMFVMTGDGGKEGGGVGA